jgi:acyl transferase domain-containing protein
MKVEPVAIIGIGCRFPGAEDPHAYWQLLRDGVDAVTEASAERAYSPDDRAAETTVACGVRHGGFLKQVDQFDPAFFKISPREAARIDPQQRLLLEVAWEAMEDAGLSMEALAGTRAGVFTGVMNDEYAHVQLRRLGLVDAFLGVGSSTGVAANRVSYTFDLRGPSMTINTLCSSSLVAVHLACRSLWSGESSPVALVGGVNVILRPAMDIFYVKSGLLAADGRCKAFDERADGLVRGEGAGLIVLKRLSQALADGDRVYAVIRGSAVNQDGRSNGMTAPSRWGQVAVMSEAYRDAGVSPSRVQYVEAHGTGTPLADAIEMAALGDVIGADRPKGSPCRVGSVKTNLGHLESASGMASLIKVALMLKHRELAPTIHFRKPHPYLRLESLPLSVQCEREPWPEGDGPALAGVNSFGLTGTNAHVVLEEPPRTEPNTRPSADDAESDKGRAYLLPLSAHDLNVLRRLAASCGEMLSASSAPSLEDFCHSAALRRSHQDFRLAAVACSREEAAETLKAFARGEQRPNLFHGRRAAGKQSSDNAPVADATLEALGEFYARGGGVEWNNLYGSRGKFVPLPSYPFQRERYWLEDEADNDAAALLSTRGRAEAEAHPLLGRYTRAAHLAGCHIWETELDARGLKELRGVGAASLPEAALLPEAAFEALALAAGSEALSSACSVEELKTASLLLTPADGTLLIQTMLLAADDCAATFHVYSRPTRSREEWALNASGVIRAARSEGEDASEVRASVAVDAAAAPTGRMREVILAESDEAERRSLLEIFLREQIGAVLDFAPSQLDAELPLSYLGLDSLLAVEIKNNVEKGLGTGLPLALLLQDANVVQLAAALSERLANAANATASANGRVAGAEAQTEADAALLLERLDELSDEEVERLLGSMMNEEEAQG